ncbi:MAG: pentapeptide repeat-containing protein [Alphaproteobacteria bacterium]
MANIQFADLIRASGLSPQDYISWCEKNSGNNLVLMPEHCNEGAIKILRSLPFIPSTKLVGRFVHGTDFSKIKVNGDLVLEKDCILIGNIDFSETETIRNFVFSPNNQDQKKINVSIGKIGGDLFLTLENGVQKALFEIWKVDGSAIIKIPKQSADTIITVDCAGDLDVSGNDTRGLGICDTKVGQDSHLRFSGTGKSKISIVNCEFLGVTKFENNGLELQLECASSKFKDDVAFSRTKFARTTKFVDCNFLGEAGNAIDVSFRHCVFSEGAEFYGSKFSRPPDFRGAAFNPSYTVEGLNIALRPFHTGAMFPLFYVYPRDTIERVRKLKEIAKSANDHEQEINFFAMELRAKRGNETDLFGAVANFLYEVSSGYGYCASRPFYWLLFLFVLFAFVFNRIADRPDVWGSMRLSLSNIFTFLPYTREIRSVALNEMFSSSEYPEIIHWLSVLESLLGVVLIFLFGLTLRNRFRM